MLSSSAAPVAATSPQIFRGLKKSLLDLVSGPQYSEYLYVDPPTVKFTMTRCEEARLNCASTSEKINYLRSDIDAILAEEKDEVLEKTLILRNAALRTSEDDFIRQSHVLASLQKKIEIMRWQKRSATRLSVT